MVSLCRVTDRFGGSRGPFFVRSGKLLEGVWRVEDVEPELGFPTPG